MLLRGPGVPRAAGMERRLSGTSRSQKGRRRLDGGTAMLLGPAMRRLLAALVLLAAPAARADHTVRCLVRSGHAGVRCLAAYTGAIERCRRTADVACETALRAPGGPLDRLVAQADTASRAPCTAADADALGYVGGLADVGLRTRQACGDFAEDLLSIGYSAGSGASTGPLLRCQRAVAARLRRLRGRVIAAFGPGCFVPALAGR